MQHTHKPEEPQSPAPWMTAKTVRRLLLLAVAAAVFGYLFIEYRAELTLESLARREADLHEFREENPVLVYGAAFLVYVAVTGMSLPGSIPLSLTIGWLFGFWRGVLLVSFASTAGATIAFLLSRYLFRDAVRQRLGDRLADFDEALKREGPFYLFMLRLIPPVPYFLINLVMGLTPIRARTFWWVSQLGMLPGTCVVIYAASQVPSLGELADEGARGLLSPQLVVAFVLLGLFPLVVRRIAAGFRT
jgi:uncharacterized membrane protein YdjX (TVP38/TMEM64 family)